MIFLTLRHCSQHKTYFCFLLTLNVKNTLHLVDGNIRLQLVESFSNFGLHLSEELLIMRTVLATKQSRTNKSSWAYIKPWKKQRYIPSPSNIFSGCLRYRYWSNRITNEFPPRGEKNPELFTNWWTRKPAICVGCVAGVKGGKVLEGEGEGGVGNLIPWD